MSERESFAGLQSGSTPPYGTEADRFARVVRAIEGEIVPRLLMSFIAPHRTAIAPHRPAGRLEQALLRRHDDVTELARLLLSDDSWAAGGFIQAMRRDRVPLDRIYLELLAPAAHRLRELWENNECDFAQFAIGMERLLNVLQFVAESANE